MGSGKYTRVVLAVSLRSNWAQMPRRCVTVRLFSTLPSTSPGVYESARRELDFHRRDAVVQRRLHGALALGDHLVVVLGEGRDVGLGGFGGRALAEEVGADATARGRARGGIRHRGRRRSPPWGGERASRRAREPRRGVSRGTRGEHRGGVVDDSSERPLSRVLSVWGSSLRRSDNSAIVRRTRHGGPAAHQSCLIISLLV